MQKYLVWVICYWKVFVCESASSLSTSICVLVFIFTQNLSRILLLNNLKVT